MKIASIIWPILALVFTAIALFQPTKVESMLYLIFALEFLILTRVNDNASR